MSHYRKLTAVAVLPVILLGAVSFGWWLPQELYYWSQRSRSTRLIRGKLRKQWMLILIYILYLLYPFVSSTVVQTFACRDIGDKTYLVPDMRSLCFTDQWYSYARLAAALCVIYCFGIPATFFGLLFSHRRSLGTVATRGKLG
jgi:hypothetical protein